MTIDGGRTGRATLVVRSAPIATAALMLVLLVEMLRQLVAARSSIGGVDFFFYLVNARDMLDGVPDGAGARFIYFPGVYSFWQMALWASGGSLAALQWWYVCVIALDAGLIAFIIGSTTRSRLAAAIGAGWYLHLSVAYEGLVGGTEPIATLPMLTALAVWTGARGQTQTSRARALVYCCGLGLTVFAKQQAVLLVPGLLGFALARRIDERSSVTLRHLVTLAAGSGVVFSMAMLALGRGLLPLRRATEYAMSYPATGSLLANLRPVVEQAPLLFVGAGLSVGLLAVVAARRAELLQGTALGAFCFCLVGALFSLWQFSTRPYLHYMLLGLPMLICAVLIGAAAVARALVRGLRDPRGTSPLLALGVSAGVCVVIAGPWASDHRVIQPNWRQDEQVARDLQTMAFHVDPGDEILVLPARRNEIHFELGSVSTASPLGYAWYEPVDLAPVVASPQLDGVIIVAPAFRDETDTAACWAQCDEAPALLSAAGFAVSARLESMTLWTPEPEVVE